MKEPARWREPLGGADPETRALLLEDRPPVPSAVEVKSMWSSLAAQLPPLPILPPAPPVPAAVPVGAAATGTLLGKITLVAVTTAVGAGVGWQGFRARHRTTNDHRTTTAKVAPPSAPPRARELAGFDPVTASTTTPAVPGVPPMPMRPDPLPEKHTRSRQLAEGPRSPQPPRAVGPALGDVRELEALDKRTASVSPPPTWPAAAVGETKEAPVGEAQEPPLAVPRAVAPVVVTYSRMAASPQTTEPPSPATSVAPYSQAAASSRTTERPSPYAINALLDEGRCLASARAALHAHDADRALDLLKSVPSSAALAQEREALTIEAMAEKPDLRAAATERALLFLRAYPDSPYRARVRSLVLERK